MATTEAPEGFAQACRRGLTQFAPAAQQQLVEGALAQGLLDPPQPGRQQPVEQRPADRRPAAAVVRGDRHRVVDADFATLVGRGDCIIGGEPDGASPGFFCGGVVAAQHHLLREGVRVGSRRQSDLVDGRAHAAGFLLSPARQGQVDVEFVAIEVGVEGMTRQRVQAQHLFVRDARAERLNAPFVQHRGAVQEDEPVAGDLVESLHRAWMPPPQQLTGLFSRCGEPGSHQLAGDQRLEQRDGDGPGQAALIAGQVMTRSDDGTSRIVDGLARHRRGKPPPLAVELSRQSLFAHQVIDGALQVLLPSCVGPIAVRRPDRLIQGVDPTTGPQVGGQYRHRLQSGEPVGEGADQVPPRMLHRARQFDVADVGLIRISQLIEGELTSRPRAHGSRLGKFDPEGHSVVDGGGGAEQVDTVAAAIQGLQVEAETAQLQRELSRRLRHRHRRRLAAGEQGIEGRGASGGIVGLQCHHLAEGVAGAVSLQRPGLHDSQTLAPGLGFRCRLGGRRARGSARDLEFVRGQVDELHVVVIAHGALAVEEPAAATVPQPEHAAAGETGFHEHVADIFDIGTVEGGRDDCAVQRLCRQSQMSLEQLAEVHATGHAERAEQHVERATVG